MRDNNTKRIGGSKMGHSCEEYMRQVGLHINFYRRKKSMTQLQLASQVGISPTYMSQIECGLVRKSVSLPLLIRIADVLEVDLAVFFEV